MKFSLFSLLIFLIIQGCKPTTRFTIYSVEPSGQNISLDLVQTNDSSVIALSALLREPQLIALETSDSCLLGASNYLIGKTFIVAFSSEAIVLFNREGEFLKTLAHSGRGPGDFLSISDYCFNSEENRLYAQDFHGQLHSWSIPEGQYTAIPYSQKCEPHSLKLINDTALLIASFRNKVCPYSLFWQSTSGKFLHGIPNRDNEDATKIIMATTLFGTGSFIYHCPHHSDSIYQIQNDTLLLRYAFDLNKNQQLYIAQISSKCIYCHILNVTETKTSQGIHNGKQFSSTVYDGYTIHFLINPQTHKIGSFQHMTDDYLGTGIDIPSIRLQSDHLTYIEYPASQLAKEIPDILRKDGLNPEIRKRLETLMPKLSENDNPYLLIGTLNEELL